MIGVYYSSSALIVYFSLYFPSRTVVTVELLFGVDLFSAAAPPGSALQASEQRLHGSAETPPLLPFLSQEGGAAVHQEVSICI